MTIYTGFAIDENGNSDYVKDTIDNARKKISEYPLLCEICSNFKDARKGNYKQNLFLILASNAISDPFSDFKPNKSCEQELCNLEITIKELKSKLTTKKFNNLSKKLGSFNENNYSTTEEIKCYRDLFDNNDIKSIDYEDNAFGTQDFHIYLIDGQEYNIEHTTINKGDFQKKIEQGYTLAAGDILSELTSNLSIKLYIATDKLTDDDKNESDEIRKKVQFEYNKLKPIIFSDYGHFKIETHFGDLSVPLYNQKEIFKLYGGFGHRLDKLAITKDGANYLKKLTEKDLLDCPIESVTIQPSKIKLVEIHSSCVWPSKAESARKEALIEKLSKKVCVKIGDKENPGQLKGKPNSIIIVCFTDFLFFNYTHPEDPFGYINYLELKEIIEKIFISKSEKEIIGVLLYNQNIFDSQFIFNPNNKNASNVEKINLLFGEHSTSGSQIIELTDEERVKYIKNSILNTDYVLQFKDLCKCIWVQGQDKFKQFLDYQSTDIINQNISFGTFELFYKDYFVTPPDRKIGYDRSSGKLYGEDQYTSKLKYTLNKINDSYNQIDQTTDIARILDVIDKNEEYYLFYNSKIFNVLRNFPNIEWLPRANNDDTIGIINIYNSKIYLWPFQSDHNLLIPKEEFILRQSNKGFKDFDEELYVSVELLDQIDIDNLNKDGKDKKTFDDKVKIRISEKFEITRHNKKGFYRIMVDDKDSSEETK